MPLALAAAQRLFSPEGAYLNTATYGLPPRTGFEAFQAAADEWRHGRTGFHGWDRSVGAAREAFARIAGSIEVVSERVSQVSSAVDQIAGGAAQVSTDMVEVVTVAEQSSATAQQVSAAAEQTSASTQQIAASAHELSRTARELDELVGRFTL
jgi:methyl-accepting chemotaxis protein